MISNSFEDPKIKAFIHSLGLKNNLTDKQINEIVESQFRFAYEKIRELNFKDMTPEEIDNTKTNFYFKFIGKIYTSSEVIRRREVSKQHMFNNLKKKEENGRKDISVETDV